MGLKATVQSLVSAAITSTVGDLASTVTFRSTTSTYDPETGSVTNAVVTYTSKGVLTNLQQQDGYDLELLHTGRKLLVPTLQLPVAVDALDDTVVVDGVTWIISEVKLDPASALFTFILKATKGVQLGG